MQGNSTPSSQGKAFIEKKDKDQNDDMQISFPVVAVGAAAGGLRAICGFLDHLRPDLDMAYVILLYTSGEDSDVSIRDMLQKRTSMGVVEAIHNMPVERNKVYIVPMENYLTIGRGQFVHLSLYRIHKGYHVIDHFFSTLASFYGNNAIAIVLSGGGADGAAGVRAIRSEGGIAFAQDESAAFRGMPQYAIESGYVDMVLDVEGIARELGAMKNFMFRDGSILWHLERSKMELSRIYLLLLEKYAVDFSLYKQATVNKHIVRRMTLSRTPGLELYVTFLEKDVRELGMLYRDLLSGVSGFFSESMLGNILQKKVFPSLLKDRSKNDPIRIWIPACAGGEEACTIAIYLIEYMRSKNLDIPIQLFATDLSEATIEAARAGFYTRAAVQHISPLRLRKFFVRREGGYQVAKQIRDVCIFAVQNFLKDPPYARLDIISCQHVLGSLEPEARKKALKIFHYALRPSGYFLLDRNDDLASSDEFFARASKEYNIYIRKPELSGTSYDFLMENLRSSREKVKEASSSSVSVEAGRVADKVMLTHYAPAGILVDRSGQMIRFYGKTAPYLRPQTGRATLELFRIVHEDLVMDLRLLLQQAAEEGTAVSRKSITVRTGAAILRINMDVVPTKQTGEMFFLIVIREGGQAAGQEGGPIGQGVPETESRRVRETEISLIEAGRQMQNMQDEFETARQDLQAAHEELLSNNEELQSINEELQTSKEELQATNEELKTMNEEVIQRNEELKEAIEYSEAIVETIRQPLLDLYSDLRIRKANKAFYQMFRLHMDEVEGHYLQDISERLFDNPDLQSGLKDAIGRRMPFEGLELPCNVPGPGERIILFNATRISGQPGRRARLLLVLEDITERRLIERRKDEFISIASHELKTPATSIQAYTQLLYHELTEANDSKNALLASRLNSQVQRLTDLTRDLLDTTSISQGQLQLKEGDFDLRGMVAEIVEEIQATTMHLLVFVSAVPELHFWGDRERLTQVVQNLITNAIKYSSHDSQVMIELRREMQNVVLRVQDFGIGMTPEVMERVFERFFRSRDPLTLRHPGLGLGLYIAHQIVQQHGGKIVVTSEKGKGSVFTVLLPVRAGMSIME